MSTTDAQIQSIATRDLDWARHHLFLLVAVVVLAVGSVYGIESLLARRAQDNWAAQKSILDQMQKQNEQVQIATKTQIDALTQQNAQLAQQFEAAMAAMAQRDAQLLKDRSEIKSLPPTTLATKWGAAANQPAPTVQSNGDFDVPLPLAQESYDALLQLPVLTKDNQTLKGQVDAETQIAQNNQSKFEQEQKAHTSDKDTCTQNINTLNAQITTIKANARKDNILYSVIAFIAGAATKIVKF